MTFVILWLAVGFGVTVAKMGYDISKLEKAVEELSGGVKEIGE